MQEKGKKLKPICALFTSNSCQQYRHFPSKNHHFSHYMRPLCNKGGSILTLTNVSKVQFFCIDIKIVFLPAARLVNMCCWSKGRGVRGRLAFWKPQFMCNLFETFGPQDFSKDLKKKQLFSCGWYVVKPSFTC